MLTKYWIRVVFVLIIFTTIVQIGGLVSPLWIYVETNITVGVGLYYRIGCEASSGGNCTSPGFPSLPFSYNSTATYETIAWNAIKGLETASAALGIILCVMMIIYLVGFGVWRKMNSLNIAMVIICILTWLPLIAGLIVYVVFYGNVITRSPDVNSRSFPWSPLMCLVAAILFVIITFLIRLCCRNRNYVKNAIPTSTDSKFAINPSTKNPLMKRYFTPSPYREERRQALYASGHYSDQSHLLGNGFSTGAIEQSTGVENMGFSNVYSRAIEYNVGDTANGSAVPVIQTNTLPVGTFAGSTATAVNDRFKATVYDRDLGSLVNNNNTGIYGTEVVKRTLVTRTVGENGYGTEVDQRRENGYGTEVDQRRNYAYQPEVRGVNSGSAYTHLQGQKSVSQVPDRRIAQNGGVFGNSVTLNRTRGYDAFSDIDAETVYYTGREGFKPITLGRESFDRSNARTSATSGGWASSYAMRQSLQPVKEEQTTVIERSTAKVPNQVFRFPADHNVTTGLQKAADYTVHTRTFTDNQAADQLVQVPGHLSGRKFAYNGTYIYRPYSESSY